MPNFAGGAGHLKKPDSGKGGNHYAEETPRWEETPWWPPFQAREVDRAAKAQT